MDLTFYITLLSAMVPVFFALGIGVVLRRSGWLSEAADGTLLRLTNNVLLPALILDAILGNALLKSPATLLLAPLFGFVAVAAGMGVAYLAARYAGRFIGLTSPSAKWTFVLCVGVFSYSYMPLGLAQNLFPSATIGVLLAHNLGVELSVWTLGLMVLGVIGALKSWKRIFSPPVIAALWALIMNLLELDRYVPRFVSWSLGILAQGAIPLGLLLIGVSLADHFGELRLRHGWKTMSAVAVLRLLLLPLLFLLAVRYLPLPVALRQAVVLQSAMPAAVVPVLLMVRHYGGDLPTAMRVTVSTTVLSLLTMPLWIYLGFHFGKL